jgi:hypothetical protein
MVKNGQVHQLGSLNRRKAFPNLLEPLSDESFCFLFRRPFPNGISILSVSEGRSLGWRFFSFGNNGKVVWFGNSLFWFGRRLLWLGGNGCRLRRSRRFLGCLGWDRRRGTNRNGLRRWDSKSGFRWVFGSTKDQVKKTVDRVHDPYSVIEKLNGKIAQGLVQASLTAQPFDDFMPLGGFYIVAVDILDRLA